MRRAALSLAVALVVAFASAPVRAGEPQPASDEDATEQTPPSEGEREPRPEPPSDEGGSQPAAPTEAGDEDEGEPGSESGEPEPAAPTEQEDDDGAEPGPRPVSDEGRDEPERAASIDAATEDDGIEWTIDLHIHGGMVMEWDDPDGVGHGFGASIGVPIEQFRVAVNVAGVFPDSRADSSFVAVWAEAWWQFIRVGPFAPHALLGIGLTTADSGPATTPQGDELPRWSTVVRPIVVYGVGLTYGPPSGLYVGLNFRAYNHTHGGFDLMAGYRF